MRAALEKRYGQIEDKIYPAKGFVDKKLAEVEAGEHRLLCPKTKLNLIQ